MIRLFLGAGRKAGIRPGDLVGRDYRRSGRHVAVGRRDRNRRQLLAGRGPESLADDIIAALRATQIRGKKVPVRRERAR